MNIVVTGATGFVGAPLVREVLAAGHTVTALTRDIQRARWRPPARCTVRSWNLPEALDPNAPRGADAMVPLAGEGIAEARWTAARQRAIRDSRADTALALVCSLGRLDAGGRPRVLVSASAIGWYGDRGDTPLHEQSTSGAGFLAEVRQDWEGGVFQAQALDVRTVAVRIGVVLGRDGGALRMLPPLFRLGLGGRVGSGQQWLSWIHLSDLVGLLRHVVEKPRAAGPVNGVAPEAVTNATSATELGRVLRRATMLPVGAPALLAVLREMSSVLLWSRRVEPTVARHLCCSFQFPRLRSALEELCADPSRALMVEQRLAQRLDKVFKFFADPANLEKIMPPFLRFRVLGMTTPQIGNGTLIHYALPLHGIPLRWQTGIESWVPNRQFVDLQTRGPYTLWHHTHEFEPDGDGTITRDGVLYRLPFGAPADVLAGRLVRRDLDAIFDYRRTQIEELVR